MKVFSSAVLLREYGAVCCLAVSDHTRRTRPYPPPLEQTTNQLEADRQVLTEALALLDDPHSMYQAGNETVCSILNQALFLRLYIDGTKVTGHELGGPFDILHDAYTIPVRTRRNCMG